MKNRLTIVYGYLGFLSVIIGILIVLVLFFDGEFSSDDVYIPILILFGLLNLLFYLLHTQFWSKKPNEIKMIELENELLKRKIENEELKGKLRKNDLNNQNGK